MKVWAMLVFSAPGRRAAALALLAASALAALAPVPVAAQSQPAQQGVPIWEQPRQWQSGNPPAPGAPARPPARPQPATAPASPVIARVGGRPVTQEDYDRLAQPYFARLHGQLGSAFTPDMERTAAFNVIDELVRRQLLALAAERQHIVPTQADVDDVLSREPAFQTNGRFDPAKLTEFKTSPMSNYVELLPRIRELAAMTRLDAALRKRFTPTPAQLRAQWQKQYAQVEFHLLPLLTRDMSLDSEATESEWAAYYHAHPDQFMRRTRVRLRCARLPLPPTGDSTYTAALAGARARARALADSLRSGALPDSAAGPLDTGLFEIPTAILPNVGRIVGVADTLARLDADSTLRVIGPFLGGDALYLCAVAEREPRHVPPMREVLGDVKRRADAEKRRVTGEAERRAYYEAHRERWRATRVALTRVTLDERALALPALSDRDVERWYAQHGRELAGLPDSAATPPPLTDSLRGVVRARLDDERRPRLAAAALAPLAAALRAGRDARAAARAAGAVVETLAVTPYTPYDTLFAPSLRDSLRAAGVAALGSVAGPRGFGGRWAVWRVDDVDTSWVPPYAAVRARSDQAFTDERNHQDETDAQAWFERHRAGYVIPVKYGLDAVVVKPPAPDSIVVPEAEVRRAYDLNPEKWKQDEQVHARHILFSTRDGGPDADRVAHARADSLLAAFRAHGGDFGELAKRFSQEPGAGVSGGDLGWFGRGRMVPEFESAAFALQPGQVSEVVHTQFGYHIIQVIERKPAGERPYDEVRAGLRQELAEARADTIARRNAESLARRLAHGGDVKALAAAWGGVTAVPPVAPNDALPGVGFVPALSPDLPRLAPGAWAARAYACGTSYVVLRLRERTAQRPAEFAEVRQQAIDDMKTSQRRAILDRKVAELRAALAAGGSLDSLAAPWGGLRDSDWLGTSSTYVPVVGLAPRVVQKAFTMKAGEVSDTLQVPLGVVWLRVDQQKLPDEAMFHSMEAEMQAAQIKQGFDAWVDEQERTVRVEILRPDLKGPRPPTLVR